MSPASYQTAPPRDVFLWRAGNGTRTRDPNLGKVVLYQLSYSRLARMQIVVPGSRLRNRIPGAPGALLRRPWSEWRRGGSNP